MEETFPFFRRRERGCFLLLFFCLLLFGGSGEKETLGYPHYDSRWVAFRG